ncbi:aldo/keto reductase [Rhizobium leguminosarum]|uniref:aldo/keto reductase n=1 Tax=Rhizobium leguminosarum TaxID=384 RepID=UPI003F9BED2F
MDFVETRGIRIPKLGLGTFRMQGSTCQDAVESAIALGYRHIDTAAMYGNEVDVGRAIKASNVDRKDLHVTTKVWHDSLSPDAIRESVARSLESLQLDHVDLLLVHWPSANMDLKSVFETFEALRNSGITRAIGACNFNIALAKAALEDLQVPLAYVQVEYHVLLDQTPLLFYLRGHGVPLTAYAPIAHARVNEIPEMISIARKHEATPTQVAIKWLLDQENVLAIPKSQRPESQKSNLDAMRIELDDEDRRLIAGLPKDVRLVNPPFAPKWD